jgi:uncharacterized protein YdeI (YjbR/CyaY-like superfamily)
MPAHPTKTDKREEPSYRPKSRADWRRWLEKNHDKATAVLLVCAKKGSGLPTVTYEESVEEALCFGWIDGVRRSVDERFFTQRFTPRKPSSNWSKPNLDRVARLKKAGLMRAPGLAAFSRLGGASKPETPSKRARKRPGAGLVATRPRRKASPPKG